MKNTRNSYLKIMYLLSLEYGKIRVTDIANKLGSTKSSVSKALVRLSSGGYIKYETYGDIILTNKSIEIVNDILSKENILELFFIGVLNISEETAKKDIQILGEYVSDETNKKLKNYIKNSLHINDDICKCNQNNNNCSKCETKKIKNRVESNQKWIDTLKEEK